MWPDAHPPEIGDQSLFKARHNQLDGALATILAVVGHVIAGRLAGLSITALCSAAMAFFLMPPLFSFRVSHTNDVLALAFYGTAGFVIAETAPSKRNRAAVRIDRVCRLGPRKRVESDLSRAVADLMSSDLGVRLRAVDFTVTGAGPTLPCTHEETVSILSDVLTAALQIPELRRISIYGGQRPGVRRLIVVANRVWPPPLSKVITIGKRDEDCEPATFPGWPSHSRVTWFDNGYGRIYQISVEVS